MTCRSFSFYFLLSTLHSAHVHIYLIVFKSFETQFLKFSCFLSFNLF